ncbi:MAG: ROK family protein [Clostridia bacterium]|nr:ROK family protein [Clostridia bacterium]
MKYCLGLDIGGTKTSIALADSNGTPIVKDSFSTEPKLGAESLVERIKGAYTGLCLKLDITKEQVAFAGVACPGPLDIKRGMIVHIATMGFRNVPIKAMLEKALEMPVHLENDANCAALAESVIGEGKGLDPLVYVTISTGIGSGIIADGKILSGACSSAGELGHLTVEPDGRECPCGKKGCLELYSSGTAIAKDGTAVRGVATETKEVFELARRGDEKLRGIIDNAADKLGLALSSVYHLIDPEVIVLGGSVTKDYADFAEKLEIAMSEYTQPVEGRKINIKISKFQGEQVLLGALIYALQNEK